MKGICILATMLAMVIAAGNEPSEVGMFEAIRMRMDDGLPNLSASPQNIQDSDINSFVFSESNGDSKEDDTKDSKLAATAINPHDSDLVNVVFSEGTEDSKLAATAINPHDSDLVNVVFSEGTEDSKLAATAINPHDSDLVNVVFSEGTEDSKLAATAINPHDSDLVNVVFSEGTEDSKLAATAINPHDSDLVNVVFSEGTEDSKLAATAINPHDSDLVNVVFSEGTEDSKLAATAINPHDSDLVNVVFSEGTEDSKLAATAINPHDSDLVNVVFSEGTEDSKLAATAINPHDSDLVNVVFSEGTEDSNPPYQIYRYLLTTALQVSTSVSSNLRNEFWLTVLPQETSTQNSVRQFIIVVQNHTDSQGGQQPGFNNTELTHQAIFQIFQDLSTGQTSTIRISPYLSQKYLEVASQLIDRHFTPIFRHPESIKRVNRTIRSDNKQETVTVVSSKVPTDDGNPGLGEHLVSICRQGMVKSSAVKYSVETNSTKTIGGDGHPVGQPIPSVRLNVHSNFNLREKSTSIDRNFIDLVKNALVADQSILAYSRAGFLSLMKGLRSKAFEELNNQQSSRRISQHLRKQEKKELASNIQVNEISYELTNSKDLLVQTPILSGSLKVTLLSTTNLIVVDQIANNDKNKVAMNSKLLLEFGSESKEVVVLSSIDPISKDTDTVNSGKQGIWDISLPVRFGDGQISFEMRVRLNYFISSKQSIARLDNELNLTRAVSILVNCSASYQTPDIGGIIGYAEFRGTVVNMTVNQQASAKLDSNVNITTTLAATLDSYKYKLFQRFARHACYRTTFLWIKKLVWCNWETAIDQWWTSNQPTQWLSTSNGTLAIQ